MADESTDRRTLITGASSGIGEEFARRCARDGKHLILVARRETKLRELQEELQEKYGIEVDVFPLDLSDHSSPQLAFDMADNAGYQVVELINNAGFGALGKFAELETARQIDMIQLNVTALTHLSRLFLPPMIERGEGRILNIASTAAFQPGPLMAVYYATKSYVLSLSTALSEELQGTGVTVTCLCPGPTKTEFADEADMADTPLFQRFATDVRSVVDAGYGGMLAGDMLVVPGLLNKLTALSARLIPRKWNLKIVRRIQS